MPSSSADHLRRLGPSCAGIYALLAVVNFLRGVSVTDPLGFQWIPFVELGWPWHELSWHFFGERLDADAACVAVNVGVFYLLGWSVQKILRRISSKSPNAISSPVK